MQKTNTEIIKKLEKKYPFISFCLYGGEEYIGIIQNQDTLVTTFYDYGCIENQELRVKFINLATEWWEESNRTIPINIFLRPDWNCFSPYLKTFNNKDLTVLHGPITSLLEIAKKKTKKRSILLVRKPT